jgi:hypothetical protein
MNNIFLFLLLVIGIVSFITTPASADDVQKSSAHNRIWAVLVPGNPSYWIDTADIKEEAGVLHTVVKTHFGTPLKLRGYINPETLITEPLDQPVAEIVTQINVNCDGSTYTVDYEKLYNEKDDAFFMYYFKEKVPTTIDTDTLPDVVRKKYCSKK